MDRTWRSRSDPPTFRVDDAAACRSRYCSGSLAWRTTPLSSEQRRAIRFEVEVNEPTPDTLQDLFEAFEAEPKLVRAMLDNPKVLRAAADEAGVPVEVALSALHSAAVLDEIRSAWRGREQLLRAAAGRLFERQAALSRIRLSRKRALRAGRPTRQMRARTPRRQRSQSRRHAASSRSPDGPASGDPPPRSFDRSAAEPAGAAL